MRFVISNNQLADRIDIDQVISALQALDRDMAALESLEEKADDLIAVQQNIEKYGVTAAVVDLVGPAMEEYGVKLTTADASMEGIKETLINTLETIIRMIKELFDKMFDQVSRGMRYLKSLGTYELPTDPAVRSKILSATVNWLPVAVSDEVEAVVTSPAIMLRAIESVKPDLPMLGQMKAQSMLNSATKATEKVATIVKEHRGSFSLEDAIGVTGVRQISTATYKIGESIQKYTTEFRKAEQKIHSTMRAVKSGKIEEKFDDYVGGMKRLLGHFRTSIGDCRICFVSNVSVLKKLAGSDK